MEAATLHARREAPPPLVEFCRGQQAYQWHTAKIIARTQTLHQTEASPLGQAWIDAGDGSPRRGSTAEPPRGFKALLMTEAFGERWIARQASASRIGGIACELFSNPHAFHRETGGRL